MLGNFTYSNPTKLYLGENDLDNLASELKNYGKNVLFCYGGGSIKKNGIYDKVVKILKECGKVIIEDGGVMPNPTSEKLIDGCKKAREGKADFILAVEASAIMQRRFLCRFIAPKTRGTNIILEWKTLITRLSPSAVFSQW